MPKVLAEERVRRAPIRPTEPTRRQVRRDGEAVSNDASRLERLSSDGVVEARGRPDWDVYLELTKPRVNGMVLLTTLVGALMAAGDTLPALQLFATLLGTWLLAGSAAALNMVMERESDALMPRTAQRPLPTRRISPELAAGYGLFLGFAGCAVLAIWVNPLVTVLGLVTMVSYLLVYTPLKRITPWSTHLGAVPGALPPMMGWAALQSSSGLGGFAPDRFLHELSLLRTPAWVLFGILFFWQLPHFFAIAWRYRADYASGGLAMLSVTDATGRSCGRQSVFFTLCLIATSALPLLLGMSGPIYLAVALALGAVFLWAAVAFARTPSDVAARRLMLSSIVYLPFVMVVMVLDRVA